MNCAFTLFTLRVKRHTVALSKAYVWLYRTELLVCVSPINGIVIHKELVQLPLALIGMP